MRRAAISVILVCALLLSGCQGITFTLDELLKAPKVADEQSAIYEALIESAGRGISLKYPRGGEYRSAFILYDIDGDREEETLAFYSVDDQNVKIAVLDRDPGGEWRSTFELAGAGTAVEKVLFSGGDMVVGYSAQDYEENAVRLYRYSSGRLEPIYEGTYSVLETFDSDGCGRDEIAIVRRSGLGIETELLKPLDDGSYTAYSSQIEESAADITSFVTGSLGGRTALYLDITTDTGSLLTEIIYLENGELACPTAMGGLSSQTLRPGGYLSLDYDGDGRVETPYLTAFTGYENTPWGESEFLTSWLSLTDDGRAFEIKSVSYTNIRDGYILTIPNRWRNLVTVGREEGTGTLTFYALDPSSESQRGEPIVSFASKEPGGPSAYEEAGYEVLYENDRKIFYVRTEAGPDMPLSLTMDEIRDNFYVIP